MTAAIEVAGGGKMYWQLQERAMLLKSVVPFMRPHRSEHWALRDIDLTIGRGETVGIVGRNGAGKTTLLRLLAGVSRPTEGRVSIHGRVAPLISVGVGFHQEMSGRENIYVNGMLLGLTRREVTSHFDEIVAFAELGDFIDTPVKFYSTGMFMRLGFSVAAHVRPDILLVDEILAVGDLAFQVKCIERMRELQRDGTTIVLVSHSMHAIRFLCPRALLIRQGQLEFDGRTEDTIARHHELMTEDHAARTGGRWVTILDRQLLGPGGPTYHPGADERLTYRCRLRFDRPVDTPQVHFSVFAQDGTVAYSLTSALQREGHLYPAGEVATVEVDFRSSLAPGTYRIETAVYDRGLQDVLASDAPGVTMYALGRPGMGGIADLAGSISINGTGVTEFGDLVIGERPEETGARE